MNSADFANTKAQQRERDESLRPSASGRAANDPGAAARHDGNGAHEPPQEAPLDAESADEDPFADDEEEGNRSSELDEGSFEVQQSPPPRGVAENRAPQRVASHDEFGDITFSPPDAVEGDADLEEPLTPEEIQRETERWAPRTARDAVIDTGIEKVCRICDKDLRGHRRYKDDKGYICPDCDRDERARRIPCAECGKPVTPEALRPWGPIAICTRCWADHESDPKLRIKRKVSSRPWEELERKSVLAMAAVALGVLLLLLIIRLISG